MSHLTVARKAEGQAFPPPFNDLLSPSSPTSWSFYLSFLLLFPCSVGDWGWDLKCARQAFYWLYIPSKTKQINKMYLFILCVSMYTMLSGRRSEGTLWGSVLFFRHGLQEPVALGSSGLVTSPFPCSAISLSPDWFCVIFSFWNQVWPSYLGWHCSHSVTRAGLELAILLPQSPSSWDHRPGLVFISEMMLSFNFFSKICHLILDLTQLGFTVSHSCLLHPVWPRLNVLPTGISYCLSHPFAFPQLLEGRLAWQNPLQLFWRSVWKYFT